MLLAGPESDKNYTTGGEAAWKLMQEEDDQELEEFMTTQATVEGTARIVTDVITFMTCIAFLLNLQQNQN